MNRKQGHLLIHIKLSSMCDFLQSIMCRMGGLLDPSRLLSHIFSPGPLPNTSMKIRRESKTGPETPVTELISIRIPNEEPNTPKLIIDSKKKID